MLSTVKLIERELIRLTDAPDTYRGIRLLVWLIVRDGNDDDLISSLISAPEFADMLSYDPVWSEVGGESVHGPYRLSQINLNKFEKVGPEEALSDTSRFVRKAVSGPDLSHVDPEGRIESDIRNATAIYKLCRPENEEDRQLLWNTLGEFEELFTINRPRQTLTCIAMYRD
jgi:hypothetical protein